MYMQIVFFSYGLSSICKREKKQLLMLVLFIHFFPTFIPVLLVLSKRTLSFLICHHTWGCNSLHCYLANPSGLIPIKVA